MARRQPGVGGWSVVGVASLVLILAATACGRSAAPPESAVPTAGPEVGSGSLATLTAVAAGLSEVVSDTGRLDVAGLPIQEADLLRQTQEAVDALAEIAPIRSFVKNQTPLATFTPDPAAPKPSGHLVYVRSRQLFESRADSKSGQALALERPMPPLWAPPEDPGRAWPSPDGQWLAAMVGSTAEMWLIRPDGRDNHAVSGPNLPSHEHPVEFEGHGPLVVKLLPGMDYTLVLTPGGEAPAKVLVDDNSRHVRGEGRLRIVHALGLAKDRTLQVSVNGSPLTPVLAYGGATRDERVPAGMVVLEARDEGGRVLLPSARLELGDRELVTVFVHGVQSTTATEVRYEPGTRPGSGRSRVRVFNSSAGPLTATIDGQVELASGLEAGAIGPYVEVAAVASEDQLRHNGQAIYGLRSREQPVAWSPDGRRLAFLGASDGQIDLYVTSPRGSARRFTNDAQEELNPVWSPNSANLAWLALDPTYGQQALYFLRGQGEPQAVDLAPLREAAGWAASAPIAFRFGVHWIDNDTLAAYPATRGTNAGIWLCDTRAGTLTEVLGEPVADPVWSAAARAWAFERQTESGVWVLPLGGQLKRVASGEAHAPDWSPDGKQLSYVEGERLSTGGWRLHVVGADGTGDRTLTDWAALVQQEPPAPGVKAKRVWLDGGRKLAFTLAGTDYGAAEEAGPMAGVEAGDDIENLWWVATDASAPAQRLTDLTRVFYMKDVTLSPDGSSLAFVGFSYLNRTQHLWVVSLKGGQPLVIDAPVRWYAWRPQ